MCECGPGRNFPTREEKVEVLKDYKESLEKEAKGVQEKIADMQKK